MNKEITVKLRIVLADDHQVLREGLKMLVNSQPDMEVVGEANNGQEAIILAAELKPDVIVMDVSMPEMNGMQATEILTRTHPEIKILTLTRYKDTGYLQQLLQAGAAGYVLKQSAAQEMIHAIRVVADGKKYLDPTITETVIENFVGRFDSRSESFAVKDLSERETEILRFIALGYANKEIAARLQLSVKTVEAHKASVMQKLNMKNRLDIVRYAILRGWMQEN